MDKVKKLCDDCVNRGKVNGVTRELYCDGCVFQGIVWRQNHYVSKSKEAK